MLAFHGLAFRVWDESFDSINRETFLEILDLVVSYDEYVVEMIEKAPKNASYRSQNPKTNLTCIFKQGEEGNSWRNG